MPPSPYTEWKFSEQGRYWYRYRRNEHGQDECEYWSGSQHPSVPRTPWPSQPSHVHPTQAGATAPSAGGSQYPTTTSPAPCYYQQTAAPTNPLFNHYSYAQQQPAPNYLNTNQQPVTQRGYASTPYNATSRQSMLPSASHNTTSAYLPQTALSQSRTRVEGPHITDESTGDGSILDSRFRRLKAHEKARFFVPGRVFLTCWTEPAGYPSTQPTTHLSKVIYGEQAFSKIRRFVVVRQKETHSICLPVQTYGGQATLKDKVEVNDHAIIYCGDKYESAPEALPGEQLTKRPIRVTPTGNIRLGSLSRINFGKTYTVEHNVKVREVGKVDEDCMVLLDSYWTSCMGLGGT